MTDEPPPINTGLPASTPSGPSPWVDDPSWRPPRPPAEPGPERFAQPDPAAVSGPPWPVLVASGPYTPPPMIRWPVAVVLAAALGAAVFLAGFGLASRSHRASSPAAWLAAHGATVSAMYRGLQAVAADAPATGPNPKAWPRDARTIGDLETFHGSVVAAAGVPAPGGAATVPWREMINDYAAGSSELLAALRSTDASLAAQAWRDMRSGTEAANRWNRAMGLTAS